MPDGKYRNDGAPAKVIWGWHLKPVFVRSRDKAVFKGIVVQFFKFANFARRLASTLARPRSVFLHCYIKQCLHASNMPKRQRYTPGLCWALCNAWRIHSHASCQFLLNKFHKTRNVPTVCQMPPLRLSHCYLIAFPGRYHSPNTSGACIQRHQVVL